MKLICVSSVRVMWFWPHSRKCFFMVEIDEVKVMHGTNCEERFEWLDQSRKYFLQRYLFCLP